MSTYQKIYEQGPFASQIDPWAEAPRYFQQIHSWMISDILTQIRSPIFEMGYLVGKETSLLIAERREPDIYLRARQPIAPDQNTWSYTDAATTILAEPGVELAGNGLPEPDAIHIVQRTTGELVTIIEIISPRNKDRSGDMWDYIERRDRLVYDKGVNVVEIDLTRSYKRLTHDLLAETYAYHIAIYMPDQTPRFIGMNYGDPLIRFALPLRQAVIPVETGHAYTNAYQQAYIAGHIETDNHYAADELPFPSLLTDVQIREALAAVARWRDELNRLKPD